MFASQSVLAIQNARLFDEIQDKNRQLAEASQNKSQFVSSMSHELRNAIIGLTEMMVSNAARFGTWIHCSALTAPVNTCSALSTKCSTSQRLKRASLGSIRKPCSSLR